MLVSGSAVTLVFKTVMGCPLGGRFFFKYLKPLSIPDGATLFRQLMEIYHGDKNVNPEEALYYYIRLRKITFHLKTREKHNNFTKTFIFDSFYNFLIQKLKPCIIILTATVPIYKAVIRPAISIYRPINLSRV